MRACGAWVYVWSWLWWVAVLHMRPPRELKARAPRHGKSFLVVYFFAAVWNAHASAYGVCVFLRLSAA